MLNAVLNDVLFLVQESATGLDTEDHYSFDYLNKNESLVPACQRIGDSDKYQSLLMDPDLSEYIIGRIVAHERGKVLPLIIKKTGLSKEDAEHYLRILFMALSLLIVPIISKRMKNGPMMCKC